MPRIRITIRHNPDDPVDDLRYAARVRYDVWAHSPVDIEPDSRVRGTHRDSQKNTYFECATDKLPEVERVIQQFGHGGRVSIALVEDPIGEACQNCGNIAGPILPTVCPTCGHRDIDSCPNCKAEVPRQEYVEIFGDLFRCPRCNQTVRFRINPDLWRRDGTLNQPVVVIENAQA